MAMPTVSETIATVAVIGAWANERSAARRSRTTFSASVRLLRASR